MPALELRKPGLLILGGTGEAAALANAAVARFEDRLRIVSSLAGRTRRPGRIAGEVRIGGFGGPDGLQAWLAANGIALLIDATHPFAARMSRNAAVACAAAGVPRLVLERPPWTRRPGDDWHCVPDLDSAARLLPRIGRRAFLSVGSGDLAAFAGVSGVWMLVRLIDPPPAPLPLPDYTVVLGRGPFPLAAEQRLLAAHRITVVVSRNSGGAATEGKIVAAREAGLPVVMIDRPPSPPGDRTETVEDALSWIAQHLAGASRNGMEARRGQP